MHRVPRPGKRYHPVRRRLLHRHRRKALQILNHRLVSHKRRPLAKIRPQQTKRLRPRRHQHVRKLIHPNALRPGRKTQRIRLDDIPRLLLQVHGKRRPLYRPQRVHRRRGIRLHNPDRLIQPKAGLNLLHPRHNPAHRLHPKIDMQRQIIKEIAMRRRFRVRRRHLQKALHILLPAGQLIMPKSNPRQVDLRLRVRLFHHQVRHLHQPVIVGHRAGKLIAVGIHINIRLIPDNPVMHPQRPVIGRDAPHIIGPQVVRVLHRQIQPARHAAKRRAVGRPGRRVLQQPHHLPPLRIRLAQPLLQHV